MAGEEMGHDPVAANVVASFLTTDALAGYNLSVIPEGVRKQIATVLAINGMGLKLEEIDPKVLDNTVAKGYEVAAEIQEIRGLPE